ECPELACDSVLGTDEWQAVYAVVTGQAPPAQPPPLGELVRMIASLGGYLGRKGDGPPGPKAMWLGMQRMTDLALGWHACASIMPPPTGDFVWNDDGGALGNLMPPRRGDAGTRA